MTRQPLHRRALRIELPAAEPAVVRASATGRQGWRLGRSRIVVAVASPVLRTVVSSGLRALGLEPQRVTTRAGLYGVAAADPDIVILSDPFDRAPVLPVIASLRTAGHRGALVVLGHASRPLRATVRAQDRYGDWYEYEGEELLARAFLHEIDHLDGHLYPEIAEKMLTAEELEEMLKQEEDAIEAEGEDE